MASIVPILFIQQGEHTHEKQIHNRGDYNDGCICSNLMRIRIFKYPNSLPNAAHITLLNFMIMLIALVFEVRDSTIIVALWMILGAVGVPVFIGGGSGIGYLTGVFGGYTFSFIIVTIFAGLTKGKKYNRIRYTIVAILTAALIDIIGMLWWKFNGNLTWKVAFLSGFVAFIPLDLVKAIIAAQIVPLFKKLMPEANANTVAKKEAA